MNILVCVDKEWGIGFKNNLPWNYPDDLEWFKKITMDGVVIMGHNTYKSLKCKKLNGRINIIIGTKTDCSDEKNDDHNPILDHKLSPIIFLPSIKSCLLLLSKLGKYIFHLINVS
jgi:dihydrofolate reductase